MHTRKAITLVEILIVVGIILILSAIVFAVSGPARQKARTVACAVNMKQWYSAAYLYATDFDGESYSELGPLVYMPTSSWVETLVSYGVGRGQLHCPDTPAVARVKMGLTYYTAFLGPPVIDSEPKEGFSPPPLRRQVNIDRREKLGEDFPTIWCTIHDELQYQPREGKKGEPWLMWIRDDGSLKQGRAAWLHRTGLVHMVIYQVK